MISERHNDLHVSPFIGYMLGIGRYFLIRKFMFFILRKVLEWFESTHMLPSDSPIIVMLQGLILCVRLTGLSNVHIAGKIRHHWLYFSVRVFPAEFGIWVSARRASGHLAIICLGPE